jgi:hypothetical protein
MMELTETMRQNAKRAWNEAALAKQSLVKILDPDEILTAIAPHVQYAPTEPAAPLTPQEKDEIWHDLCIPCRDVVFSRVDEVLAKRPAMQPSAMLTKADWDALADAVDMLNKWVQGRYIDEAGNSPTWNDTCTRLRDLRDKCDVAAPTSIASVAQADWEDQHRGTQPAPVDGDLADRAMSAFLQANHLRTEEAGRNRQAVDAVIRLIQQDSNARWSKAAAAYLLDEHGWNVSDALFASSKIRARVEDGSLPPTLQERITKRFQQAKLVNGAAWDPNTLAATVMEEIAKETK